MSKIKVSKNKKIVAFDFYSNLLDNDKLCNLCKLFNLQDIYMDIYTVDIRKKNFYQILLDKKICEKIFYVPYKHLQDIHIKITIDKLPEISQLLSRFEFEEFTIWDCYTSWEKYLNDKTAKTPFFTFKLKINESDSKFYLNYKESEISIICDLIYDNQNMLKELSALINTI